MIKEIFCNGCGRDLDEIGQDNVSPISGYPICEDCIDTYDNDDLQKIKDEINGY
jgi:hypothetical protein